MADPITRLAEALFKPAEGAPSAQTSHMGIYLIGGAVGLVVLIGAPLIAYMPALLEAQAVGERSAVLRQVGFVLLGGLIAGGVGVVRIVFWERQRRRRDRG